MRRTAIAFGVVGALCGLTIPAVGQSKAKEKPVNLLRLAAAAVEKAPAERDAVAALADEDAATVATFAAAKDAPADVVYGFGGATVTPEKLVVRMWLYPYLTWATAALIVFVLGYMLTDTEHDGRETVLLSLLVAAIVVAVAFLKQRLKARDEAQDEARAEV